LRNKSKQIAFACLLELLNTCKDMRTMWKPVTCWINYSSDRSSFCGSG